MIVDNIPPECLDNILSNVAHDRRILHSVLLVNRHFHSVAVQHLYRNVWRYFDETDRSPNPLDLPAVITTLLRCIESITDRYGVPNSTVDYLSLVRSMNLSLFREYVPAALTRLDTRMRGNHLRVGNDICIETEVIQPFIRALADRCPCLVDLIIGDDMTLEQTNILLSSFPRLRRVVLSMDNLTDNYLNAVTETCHMLRELVVKSGTAYSISDATMAALIQAQENLESFTFDTPHHIGPLTIIELTSRHATTLTSLSIVGPGANGTGILKTTTTQPPLERISQLSGLQHLRISGDSEHLTTAILASIFGVPLPASTTTTTVAAGPAQVQPAPAPAPALVQPNLIPAQPALVPGIVPALIPVLIPDLAPAFIPALAPTNDEPVVAQILVQPAIGVGPPAPVQVVDPAQNLVVVDDDNTAANENENPESASKPVTPLLSHVLPNLSSLDFSETSLDDASIDLISSALNTRLKHLTLFGIYNILSSRTLAQLGQRCPNLQHFRLDLYNKAECDGVRDMVGQCPDLYSLVLGGMCIDPAVAESTIEGILSSPSASKLEILDIGHWKLSDPTLAKITNTCKKLRELGLQGCSELTDDGLNAAFGPPKMLTDEPTTTASATATTEAATENSGYRRDSGVCFQETPVAGINEMDVDVAIPVPKRDLSYLNLTHCGKVTEEGISRVREWLGKGCKVVWEKRV